MRPRGHAGDQRRARDPDAHIALLKLACSNLLAAPARACRSDSGRLLNGNDVAVWVCEPRNARASRRGPDVVLVLGHAVVAPECHARRSKCPDRRGDVRHPPAERGIWRSGGPVDQRDTELRPVCVIHVGKLARFMQTKPEDITVKSARHFQITTRHERHQICLFQYRADQRYSGFGKSRLQPASQAVRWLP